MESYTNSLKKLGLTESQAKLYIVLLGEKQATAQEIVEMTNENRTTVYMILARLEELGLVSKTTGTKTAFVAESPSKLKTLLAKQQQVLKDAQAELTTALPALNRTYVISHQKPGVVYLEGIDGLKLIYNDIIDQRKEFLILPSKDSRTQTDMNNLIERNINLQKKFDIWCRTIYPTTLRRKTDVKQLKENKILVRFFGDELHHNAQIIIYGNSAAISTFEQGIFTTLITSEAVAITLRGYFESMWQAGII